MEIELFRGFQSLTRDSNHSNYYVGVLSQQQAAGFNPSRGIAIIQTLQYAREQTASTAVSIPHAG